MTTEADTEFVTITIQVEPSIFAAIDAAAGDLLIRPAEFVRRFIEATFTLSPEPRP